MVLFLLETTNYSDVVEISVLETATKNFRVVVDSKTIVSVVTNGVTDVTVSDGEKHGFAETGRPPDRISLEPPSH